MLCIRTIVTVCIELQSLGQKLLKYSSPTDEAEPFGLVVVEAHYGQDYTMIVLIGIACGGFLILSIIVILVSASIRVPSLIVLYTLNT